MAVTWSDQPQMDELWDKAISAISWLFHRCGCLAAGPWSRLSNFEVQSWSLKSAHSNLLWMQIWSESNVWLILNRIFHWSFVFVRIRQLELTQQIQQFHWNSQFPFKNLEMETSGKVNGFDFCWLNVWPSYYSLHLRVESPDVHLPFDCGEFCSRRSWLLPAPNQSAAPMKKRNHIKRQRPYQSSTWLLLIDNVDSYYQGRHVDRGDLVQILAPSS